MILTRNSSGSEEEFRTSGVCHCQRLHARLAHHEADEFVVIWMDIVAYSNLFLDHGGLGRSEKARRLRAQETSQ